RLPEAEETVFGHQRRTDTLDQLSVKFAQVAEMDFKLQPVSLDLDAQHAWIEGWRDVEHRRRFVRQEHAIAQRCREPWAWQVGAVSKPEVFQIVAHRLAAQVERLEPFAAAEDLK